MKIAVTHENGAVFGHFGHTKEFKIYETNEGKILSSEIVATDGQGHGALAGLLESLGVSVLICGGIGGGAQLALAEADIELHGGIEGECDAAVEAFLAGTLRDVPHATCDHHGHHHHGGHTCGAHGCGEHHDDHACDDHHHCH